MISRTTIVEGRINRAAYLPANRGEAVWTISPLVRVHIVRDGSYYSNSHDACECKGQTVKRPFP